MRTFDQYVLALAKEIRVVGVAYPARWKEEPPPPKLTIEVTPDEVCERCLVKRSNLAKGSG